jgi:hypothetical protein
MDEALAHHPGSLDELPVNARSAVAAVQADPVNMECTRRSGCRCADCSAMAAGDLGAAPPPLPATSGAGDGRQACPHCGRKFAGPAFEKHVKICAKSKAAAAGRKKFDMSSQRRHDDARPLPKESGGGGGGGGGAGGFHRLTVTAGPAVGVRVRQ